VLALSVGASSGPRTTFTLAVALSSYAIAGALGGSGFIAAFVAGMAFGWVSRQHGLRTTYLAEEAGSILAAVTWMGFGALAISKAWPNVTWHVMLYAVLSLTVVRMLPVAVAMIRSGARWQTVTFMGWFGPRGLASIVFGLLALESGVPNSRTLLSTVVVTVGLSVFLHGLTAKRFVAAYHHWYASQTKVAPSSAEAMPTRMPRRRRRPGPDDTGPAAWSATPTAKAAISDDK
jgi:sodium/hydrogen antiporter